MKLEPHLIMNGVETEEYEFKAIVARPDEKRLDIILYKKKPLDKKAFNEIEESFPTYEILKTFEINDEECVICKRRNVKGENKTTRKNI